MLAIVPWLIEVFWLCLWVPIHARRLRNKRRLEAVFGPGYFDMSQPMSEWRWLMVFGLYHFPPVLVTGAVRFNMRRRYPWLVIALAMLGTPVLYSGLLLWSA